MIFSQQEQWASASSLSRVTHSKLKIKYIWDVFSSSTDLTLNKGFDFGSAVCQVWGVGQVLVAVHQFVPLWIRNIKRLNSKSKLLTSSGMVKFEQAASTLALQLSSSLYRSWYSDTLLIRRRTLHIWQKALDKVYMNMNWWSPVVSAGVVATGYVVQIAPWEHHHCSLIFFMNLYSLYRHRFVRVYLRPGWGIQYCLAKLFRVCRLCTGIALINWSYLENIVHLLLHLGRQQHPGTLTSLCSCFLSARWTLRT